MALSSRGFSSVMRFTNEVLGFIARNGISWKFSHSDRGCSRRPSHSRRTQGPSTSRSDRVRSFRSARDDRLESSWRGKYFLWPATLGFWQDRTLTPVIPTEDVRR